MKTLRKFLMLTLILLISAGCSTKESDSIVPNKPSATTDKITLNLQHADLIAKFTNNEKYLNKNLLYDITKLDDDDNVSIIVTMDEDGLSKDFTDNNSGYNSLASYATSEEACEKVENMKKSQDDFAEELISKNYIESKNHSYVTLFNGFSAKTTYGQFKKLLKADYDVRITISEVYSMPETQTLSATNHSSTDEIYDAVINQVKVYETGIFDSSGVDYTGNNTAVAILDSGFDIHHTVFQSMPEVPMLSRDYIQNLLKDSKAYGYDTSIKVQDVYVNSKIPFAYDYADKDTDVAAYDSNHGTHVAGIIGGKDDVITGVAVNTQLVLMKVFGDVNNGAVQEDILAALEDAILIGVDAINLSLGTSCGFARESDKEYVNEVYDKIEASGISLVVAASNDYSSGYGGENSNTNKASNPDSATVGSPGTYASTISVASISGLKSKYIITEDGYTFFFNNANDSAGEPYDFYDMLFEKLDSDEEEIVLEYVTVPGVGKSVNYSTIDVKGKIALVRRGDTSFEDKAKVALAQGAIACIIYNNIAGDVFMNAGTGLELPLCSLSKDDGEYLAAKASGKLILKKSFLAGPFMSGFSSWGPVSNLSLKPEITAHGGSILSSVPGGGYEEVSGTSMACPNLCGVIILVRQALKERYPDMDAKDLIYRSNQLLMSTATIILDEQGNPYSPRKQGSGLGNLEFALDTLAYISVDGTTKTKLELKDDPNESGEYTLNFNVNNTSNEVLQYRLTNLTMTESLSVVDPEYVAEKAYMLDPTTNASLTGDGSLNGDIVTISAGGTVKISYTLKLTPEEIDYIHKSFINGIYVEGFAVLESMNEDQIDLSVPFLAFFGDWTQAPMFDKTYYEVESEAHSGAIDEEDKLKADYYATTPLGTYYYSYVIPLGSYVYEMDESKYDPIPASEEHAAIGYNLETINGITTVYAGLLRNAKKMTTIIKNAETGEIVYEHIKYDEHKAYFNGSIVPGYDLIDITARELGLQNNTKYTFTMTAELDYGDGGITNNLNNTFEFSFYVDYQAPIITNAEFSAKYDKTLEKYRYYVDVSIYDNHYVQSIRPFTIVNGELSVLSEYVTPVYSEKNNVNKVTLEITDYMDLLQYSSLEDDKGNVFNFTNGLGFLVDDYALNQAYTYVTLPGTNSSTIEYLKEYYSNYEGGVYQYKNILNIGDELDLTYMLTSDDMEKHVDGNSDNICDECDMDLALCEELNAKYFSSLKWETTNSDVIKVYRGQIEAVGAGEAIIKCSTIATTGEVFTINLKITVNDNSQHKESQRKAENKLEDIKFTYFDVIRAFESGPDPSEIGETGDKIFFTEKQNISCYPGEIVNINYEITPWNLKNYTLKWESTNPTVAKVENGRVEALKEGTATITLKVIVDGRESALMATTKINVKNEFIIEGNTLVAYKGLGGDVIIPDDKGILYIGSYSFSLYTTDYEIEIEEDDYDAAKTPSSNESIISVIIPANVKEVQKFAFFKCTALEKVTFLKDEEGKSCPFIKEYAFYGNENLTEINLTDIDLIGASAFEGCSKLVDIDISKTYAIGASAFKNCVNLGYVDLSSLRNAGKGVFENCKNLTEIHSDIFTNFSSEMFKNSGLKELDFYAKKIPNNCFENCDNLIKVTINNSISYIGQEAFIGCDKLKEVQFDIGAGSEFILASAFMDCKSLETITLPDSEFEIELDVFKNCNSLFEINFNQYTKITNNLGNIFAGCDSLQTFIVNPLNKYYQTNEYLLLSKDGKEIILAAPKHDYNDYVISDEITKIAEGAFSSISSITTLVTNNVLEIGASAFEDCTNLHTLTISLGDIKIAEKAFKSTSLMTINNLENLKVINDYVFANTKLTSLNLNNVTLGIGAFADCMYVGTMELSAYEVIELLAEESLTFRINEFTYTSEKNKTFKIESLNKKLERENSKIVLSVLDLYKKDDEVYCHVKLYKGLETINITADSIADYAFAGCKVLRNATINSSIIGQYAFADCIKLNNLVLNDVQKIDDFAFMNCGLLTNVVSNTVEEIGQYAFTKCLNLETINFSNIVSIGDYAFSQFILDDNQTSTNKLSTLVFGDTLKTIGEGAFRYSDNLISVEIGEKVEKITKFAFSNCSNLETFTILGTLRELEEATFNENKNLHTVNIKGLEVIGDAVFYNCEKLENIDLSNVIQIKTYSFYCCTALEEANMPKVIEIGDAAFVGATSLSQIYMPRVEVIGIQGLSNIAVSEIVIPSTIKFIDNAAFMYNINQTTFVSELGETTCKINNYALIDQGVLYTVTGNNKYLLTAYPTAKSDSKYEVIYNTVRIAEDAASYNLNIETVVFPDSLRLLGNMCFYGCDNLKTIEFKSTTAPTLEGTIQNLGYENDQESIYDQESEIYQYLNKYFQFNGYYPLYYAQFKDLIGKTEKLNIIVPNNADLDSYHDELYMLYFDMANLVQSKYIALNQYSIDYLYKVALIPNPEDVTLKDGDVIKAAKAAYELVNQDFSLYPEYFDEEELVKIAGYSEKLNKAKEAWDVINKKRINKTYSHVIQAINELGNVYQFEKLKDYYAITNQLELIDRNDLAYIKEYNSNFSNVDEFKKSLDAYLKGLNEDINVLTDATKLPTSAVNKVGLTIISASVLTTLGLVVFFKKRWF